MRRNNDLVPDERCTMKSLMFHPEILASLNFNKNKMLSPGLENNHTLKVVLANFQHNHICQDCLKNTRSTFECMVILQSRGHGPDSWWKYGTDLSHCFGTCPLDLRITINSNVDMVFFQQSWHLLLCWKIANISVYGCSQIQGTTFYSCWNLMKPGSQSGTYVSPELLNIAKTNRILYGYIR